MNSDITSTPICDFLRDYASSGTSRFHMPGHKGCLDLNDITEIKGADSLYEASGIILKSERNASKIFGSASTLYSVQGSSQCICAMLALASGSMTGAARPVVLAARNVHRSFINACALLDMDVKWLFPEEAVSSLYSCPVNADQVSRAISSMKRKPCAVYITSPDYLGHMQDVRGIADAAHKYNIPLLVDNAHGSYLHFLDIPAHPMDLGADICCDSAHKTLPALTGCAYLHIGKNAPEFFSENARKAMSMFGSTSPSYLLLASLDRTNAILSSEEWHSGLLQSVNTVLNCKQELSDTGWQISGNEPLKIAINTRLAGYSGSVLADMLREHCVECEYADTDHIVFMASPYNSLSDFETLMDAMRSIHIISAHSCTNNIIPCVHPVQAITIRQAAFAPSETVPIEKAAGRICAHEVISCPPAVPVIACGEVISEEMLPILRHYGIHDIAVCCMY